MVWFAFLVAIILCGLVIYRQHKIFTAAVVGRDYYLGPKSLETEDPMVKMHYRKYVLNSLVQIAPILGLLVLVLIYVG